MEKQPLLQKGSPSFAKLSRSFRIMALEESQNRYIENLPPVSVQVVSGILVGIMLFAFCNVFGSIVFMQTPALFPYLQIGIAMNTLTAAISCGLNAKYSKFHAMISGPDMPPAIILVSMVSSLQRILPAHQLLPTLLVAVPITTIFISTSLYVLGRLHLTRLVQFIPTVVIRGFLALMGMEVLRTAVHNATAEEITYSSILTLTTSWTWWSHLAPALAVGIPLYFMKRKKVLSSTILFPSFVLLPVIGFYCILFLTWTSIDEARGQGWMYPEVSSSRFWSPWEHIDIYEANVVAVLSLLPQMLVAVVLVLVDLLLKLAAVESNWKVDVDFDHEFQLNGKVNILLALLFLPPGYPTFKLLAMNTSIAGSTSHRLSGYVAAGFNLLLFLAGFPLVNYLPRLSLAGLFFYACLGFLMENLYDSYWHLPKLEYLLVWGLVAAHMALGLLPCVALGMMMAVFLFAVEYGHRSPIKLILTGRDFRAVTRKMWETTKLEQLGEIMITIVQLHGYIFFGSSSQIIMAIQDILYGPPFAYPHYLIIDLEDVSGMDSAAISVFNKISRRAQSSNITVLWTGVEHSLYKRLKHSDVLTKEATFPRMADGVEWAEDRILKFSLKQRRRWIVTDVLRYQYTVHYIEDLAMSSFVGVIRPASVERFLSYCRLLSLRPGETVCRVGDEPNVFYYMRDGRLDVFLNTSGESKHIGTRVAGAFINASSFWLGEPCQTTYVASEHSNLLEITRESLRRMQRSDPDLAFQLTDSILRHYLMTDTRHRRRLAAFGGAHGEVTSLVSRSTFHLSKLLASSYTIPEFKIEKGEQYITPQLLPIEITQYTNLYNLHAADGEMINASEHSDIRKAIQILVFLHKAQPLCDNNIRVPDPSGEAMEVRLDEFLDAMRYALLTPIPMSMVNKLRGLYDQHCKDNILDPDVFHKIMEGQGVKFEGDYDEFEILLQDLKQEDTFDTLLQVFSRMKSQENSLKQLEEAYHLFLPYRPNDQTSFSKDLGLTLMDLKCALTEILGLPNSRDVAQCMLIEADTTRSGSVTFPEFVATIWGVHF